MSTTEGLVTREYLDELWSTSLAKITAVLRNNSVSTCHCDMIEGNESDVANIVFEISARELEFKFFCFM